MNKKKGVERLKRVGNMFWEIEDTATPLLYQDHTRYTTEANKHAHKQS